MVRTVRQTEGSRSNRMPNGALAAARFVGYLRTPCPPSAPAPTKPGPAAWPRRTHPLVEAFTTSYPVDCRLYPYDIAGSIAHCRMLAKQRIIPRARRGAHRRAASARSAREFDARHVRAEARGRRHPHGDRAPADRADRSGRRQAAHGAQPQRSGRARPAPLRARRDRRHPRASSRALQPRARPAGAPPRRRHHARLHAPAAGAARPLRASSARLRRDARARRRRGSPTAARAPTSCRSAPARSPARRSRSTAPSSPASSASRAVSENSLDAVSDRDFVAELLAALAILGMHLSRFADEIVLWSSQQFGFIELPDAFATGSSMMPQKKNPDVAELIRGKTGRLYGNLVALLTMLKGLPLAYNRDLQEDKAPLFDSVDTVIACARGPRPRWCRACACAPTACAPPRATGYTLATELADYLASKGVPFRDAHGVVGAIVQCGDRRRPQLEDLSLAELRALLAALRPRREALAHPRRRREAPPAAGGTAPANVERRLKHARRLRTHGSRPDETRLSVIRRSRSRPGAGRCCRRLRPQDAGQAAGVRRAGQRSPTSRQQRRRRHRARLEPAAPDRRRAAPVRPRRLRASSAPGRRAFGFVTTVQVTDRDRFASRSASRSLDESDAARRALPLPRRQPSPSTATSANRRTSSTIVRAMPTITPTAAPTPTTDAVPVARLRRSAKRANLPICAPAC